MRILIIAATEGEIKPLCGRLGITGVEEGCLTAAKKGRRQTNILVTGVGMVKTAFEMGRMTGNRFDLAIHAGVAGSFGRFQPGDVVNVTSDCFSELGAEDGGDFIAIDRLGLGAQRVKMAVPFRNAFVDDLPSASGITVNTVHGHDSTIRRVRMKYNPDVESMEGAAFIHAANRLGFPALQLRAISNMVERRNRKTWKMKLAVERLDAALSKLFDAL